MAKVARDPDTDITLRLLETHAGVSSAMSALDTAVAKRREAVAAARAAGWSMQRIADHIGVSKTAVANIIAAGN